MKVEGITCSCKAHWSSTVLEASIRHNKASQQLIPFSQFRLPVFTQRIRSREELCLWVHTTYSSEWSR